MKTNQRFHYFILTLCLLLSSFYLVACRSSGSEEATAVSVESESVASESAEAADAPESPLPVSESESPDAPVSPLPVDAPVSPLFVPVGTPPEATPSETTGSVVGAVVVKPASEGEGYRPFANSLVSIAGILERPGDNAQVAGYEPSTAPKATSDEYGRFALNDVIPGKYALILDMVIHQHLVLDPDSGDGIVFEVVAGETVDLGTFLYDSLPIIGYE